MTRLVVRFHQTVKNSYLASSPDQVKQQLTFLPPIQVVSLKYLSWK